MRQKYPDSIKTLCHICGKTVSIQGSKNCWRFRKTGRWYCSEECRHIQFGRTAQTRAPMSEQHRKMHSRRMRLNNPMYDPNIKERMKTTLRAMGWKPPVQGGNGHGPTYTELLLASTLGWELGVTVSCGIRRRGYPTCYKLDVANRKLKVAIEVDGNSHYLLSRREQDRKKE